MNELNKSIKIEQGKRLSDFRNFLGKTQIDFAQSISLDRAYLAQIETGSKSISHNVLTNVTLSYKNLNTDWLLNGVGPMVKTEDFVISKIDDYTPNVRFLNIAAQAGVATLAQLQEQPEWLFIPGLEKRGDYYGLLVEGNSMLPTLKKGDLIICIEVKDIKEDFENDLLYVIVSVEGVLVKRIKIQEDQIKLISDNPMFATTTINYTDIIRLYKIITRVTSLI
jgi:phage repressor protein C with HTH and peptisase S24 domain